MKKTLLFSILIFFAFSFICLPLSFSARVPFKAPKESKKKASKKVRHEVYMCPMHPEVKSDKPGKCSKCGMNLEKPPFRHAVIANPDGKKK